MFKRVLYMLKAKRFQSLLALILFLIVFTAANTAGILYFAADDAREKVLAEIGVEVSIYPKDSENREPVTEDMLEQVRSTAHVEGINISTSLPVIPVNFENDKSYTGIDPATQNDSADDDMEMIQERKEEMSMIGCVDITQIDQFRREFDRLTAGNMPEKGKNEVLISKQVAEKNGISVGDTLQFEVPDYYIPLVAETALQVTVSGLYETTSLFEILDTNFMGEAVYAISPYNTVYTTIDVVTRIQEGQETNDYYSIQFWVDSMENADPVLEQILLYPGFEEFQGVNGADIQLKQFASSLLTLNAAAKNAMLAVLWFGALFVCLFSTFWGSNYRQETGILLALGHSKRSVLGLILMEILTLVILAGWLSIPVSLGVAEAYASGLSLVWSDINLVSSVNFGAVRQIEIPFEVCMRFSVLLVQLLTAAGMSLCALLAPTVVVNKYEPREIFNG